MRSRQTPSFWRKPHHLHETAESLTRYCGRYCRILADLGQCFTVRHPRVGFRRGTISMGEGGVDLKNMGMVYPVARPGKLCVADCVDGATQGNVGHSA